MEPKKLKMNPKKFNRIWTIVIVIVTLLAIVATYLMNFFSLSMEIFLGRGDVVVTTNENMADADTAYYEEITGNLDEITDAAALEIAREGEVLFKNNGVLPLEKGSDVTPFGYRYISPIYGGTGSGNVNTDSPRIISAQAALNNYFNVNQDMESVLEGATAQGMTSDGYERPDESGGFEGATSMIIEYEDGIYNGHEASCAGTTGIVFIGRSGGEGRDVCADVKGSPIEGKGYADGTPHQLALSEDEKEMIRFSKANCENTVVILDTSNVMEISELMEDGGELSADAILWIGGPGAQGFEAMAEILCGEVNPSGKATDTWMTDIMSYPVMENFGNFEYKDLYLLQGGYPNPVGDPTEMNFVEYEENIYVGYRYYETVDDTDGSFSVFGKDGCSYDDAVQIPFGYGLNYGTDFSQEIQETEETEEEITLHVNVTNHGTRAGKEVVQVYYNPPYTEFDVENKIEKSTVNLVAFDKTKILEPEESEEIEVTISKEDMASYCYTHENADDTIGAYVLEAGEYSLSINKSAHEEYDTVTFTVDETTWYDSENPRQSEKDGQAVLDETGKATDIPAAAEADETAEFTAASNRFQEMSDHMENTDQLTRASGTLTNTATSPTEEEMSVIPEGFYYTTAEDGIMTLQQMDLDTNETLGNVDGSEVYTEEMPVTNAEQTLTLADMRGLSYFDPAWDTLMDQLDLSEESLYVALAASYDQTAAVESVSKPATVDFDGPQGIVGSITDSTEYTAYPSEPIIAATFNVELTYEMGRSVGLEAADAGVNSWYAPAMNIHRSPFSGRNFEYYSEDPVLSGYMAVNEVSGAADQGLICTIKHFALNDEEMYDNDRSRVSVWANEQAIREIYMKPFEMAVKDARMNLKYVESDGSSATKIIRGTTAVMGCMNYLGTTWGGASYALNTELLRDEWGFQGFVITDMVMNAGSNGVDECLRSGSDTWMAWGDAFTTLIKDTKSPTGVSVIRRAVKNMCYSIANSRAMNGFAPGTVVTYKTSPWKIWLTVADVLVGLFVVTMIAVMIRRTKDSKVHPENYMAAKEKKPNK